MGTLVEQLLNFCDYFFRPSGLTDLSGKYFQSLLNSPNLITQQYFVTAMKIK